MSDRLKPEDIDALRPIVREAAIRYWRDPPKTISYPNLAKLQDLEQVGEHIGKELANRQRAAMAHQWVFEQKAQGVDFKGGPVGVDWSQYPEPPKLDASIESALANYALLRLDDRQSSRPNRALEKPEKKDRGIVTHYGPGPVTPTTEDRESIVIDNSGLWVDAPRRRMLIRDGKTFPGPQLPLMGKRVRKAFKELSGDILKTHNWLEVAPAIVRTMSEVLSLCAYESSQVDLSSLLNKMRIGVIYASPFEAETAEMPGAALSRACILSASPLTKPGEVPILFAYFTLGDLLSKDPVEPTDLRTCKECGRPFLPRRSDALYCSSRCTSRVTTRRKREQEKSSEKETIKK